MSTINDQNYVVPETKRRRSSIESQALPGLTFSFTMIVASIAVPLLIFSSIEIKKRLPEIMPVIEIQKEYTTLENTSVSSVGTVMARRMLSGQTTKRLARPLKVMLGLGESP